LPLNACLHGRAKSLDGFAAIREHIFDGVVDRVTAVAPVKLVPVIATLLVGPMLGETEVTVGADLREEEQ
jgi:hypothetical protein